MSKIYPNVHTIVHVMPASFGLEIITLSDFYDRKYDNLSPFQPHMHDYYEIIWFEDGGGQHVVDFATYDVQPHTVFFIAPGQIHSFDETRHEGLIIKFTSEFMNEEHSSEDIFLSYRFFSAFNTIPYFSTADPDTVRGIKSLVRALSVEYQDDKAYAHHDVLKALMRILLIYLERAADATTYTTLDTAKTSHYLYIKFRMMVEQQYAHCHQVQDYASQLNVSPKYLGRCVADSTQLSPLQIINDRILLEAKRQLRYSTLSVKEIAFNLSFEDPSYFVKFFKRLTGKLPGEFRKS